MAKGALVDHVLPSGKVIQVPSYLAPSGELGLPDIAKPDMGPDQRLAYGFGDQSGTASMLAQQSPDFAKVQDFARSNPAAQPGAGVLSAQPVPEAEEAQERARHVGFEKATEAAKEHYGNANPDNLKPVPKPDPRHASGILATTAQELYGKPGVGGTTSTAPNLSPVVSEIKEEITPGEEMLPEVKWRLGLEKRPDEWRELDPEANKDMPTIGDEAAPHDWVYRDKLTPREKSAAAFADAGVKQAESQMNAQRLRNVVQKDMLVDQSNALDNQLNGIAEKRNRIADLQAEAAKRGQEARDFSPRTREQVWKDKGTPAQIIGIIGAALGQYSAILGHGSNAALDMINKVLDSAVDDDRAKFERLQGGSVQAKGDLADAMRVYGDLDMATLDNKQRKTQNAIAIIDAQAANRSLDDNQKSTLANLRKQLEMQALTTMQQQADLAHGIVNKREVTMKPYASVVPKGAGGGGGAKPRISGDKFREMSAEQRALGVKMPDGFFKFVRSPQERIPKQEQMNAARDMRNILVQLQTWRADKSNAIPWSEKRGKLEAAGSRLLELSKRKDQLGALDKGLLDFATKKFGKPEEFNVVDSTVDGKIAQQIDMLDSEIRNISERDLDDSPYALTEGGVTPEGVRQ